MELLLVLKTLFLVVFVVGSIFLDWRDKRKLRTPEQRRAHAIEQAKRERFWD